MPTTNPRLSLTLPPHRYDLITRLATLQGVSRAYLVNDMLEEIYPVLERVCVVLEAAKQSQASVKHGLRRRHSRRRTSWCHWPSLYSGSLIYSWSAYRPKFYLA